MRSLAILLIVVTHLSGYTSAVPIPAGHFVAELGRTLFVFISGYALTVAYARLVTWRDVKSFCRKRLARIYPLYIPALFTFVVLFHCWGVWHPMDITPLLPTMIAHVIGGQMLLSPLITPMETLWFIGCISLYYCVYVVLAKYTQRPTRMMVLAAVVFVFFAAVKGLTGLVEYRFFYYYPIFVGGVLAGNVKVLPRYEVPRRGTIVSVFVGTIVMIGVAILLWSVRGEFHEFRSLPLPRFLRMEAMCLLFSTAGVLASLGLSKIVVARLSDGLITCVLYLSASSYAMYLFHRPILALLAVFLRDLLGLSGYLSDIAVIAMGLPLVVFVSHNLQRLSDAIVPMGIRNKTLGI